MKKNDFILISALSFTIFCLFAVSGCTALSNHSVITEYNAEGNIVKVTESNESVVTKIVESTKNKTVIVWEDGWMAYVSASTATTADPTPTLKMFAGKSSRGAISALPEQTGFEAIPAIIQATRADLAISASGVVSETMQKK